MKGERSPEVRALAAQAATLCGAVLLLSAIPWAVMRLSNPANAKGVAYVSVTFSVGGSAILAAIALFVAVQMPLAWARVPKSGLATHATAAGVGLGIAFGLPGIATFLLGEHRSAFWYLVYGVFIPAGFVVAVQVLLLLYAPFPGFWPDAATPLRAGATVGGVFLPLSILSFWYQFGDYFHEFAAPVLLFAGGCELIYAYCQRHPSAGGGDHVSATD